MCVYREENGSSCTCRIEGSEVDPQYCTTCPYLKEEKRGFCAFLKNNHANSESLLFFQRYCTRDTKVVWLNECCVCPYHT